jgi:Ca2+-binding RTX toxin-like protein
VNYTTVDGTAVAGADYADASGVLQFAAGETSKTVTIALTDDSFIESRESFSLRLSPAANATIADGEALATILDNDRPSEFNDDLIGTAASESIDLLGGNDRFEGLAGDDSISGGAGDDTIFGGDGADVIDGGTGSNLLHGEAGDDRFLFTLGAPFDVSQLRGGEGVDTLDARQASGAVLFRAQKSGDEVSVGDLTTGSTQAAVSGVETWLGSQYGDVFSFASMGVGLVLDGGAGDDHLTGGSESDWILGGDGNDHIDGNEGTNHLSGGAGDDLFWVSRGSGNTIDGGEDFDTLDLSGLSTGAQAIGFENGGFEISTGTLLAAVANVERLIGSTYADDLNFTFATQALALEGGAGDDLIVGGAGADVLSGGEGADTLDGGGGSDVVFGDGGDDHIFIAYVTDPSTDTIFGGSGIDLLDGRDSSSALYVEIDYTGSGVSVLEKDNWNLVARVYEVERWIGSGGDDQFYLQSTTQSQSQELSGERGNDILVAGLSDDVLLGGEGDDFLRGWLGNDLMDGGAGNDTVALMFTLFDGVDFSFSENSAETPWIVAHDEGTDTITNVEVLNVRGSYFDDRITGGSGDDWLNGNDGNDQLKGGDGDDHLSGDWGADVLVGGLGADELEGGAWDGQDSYRYTSLAESNAVSGIDTILNHGTTEDRIDISQIDADPTTSETEATSWIFVGEAFREDLEAAQATLSYDPVAEGTWLRLYLSDGDPTPDFEVLISGARVNESILIGVSPPPETWFG